MKNQPPRKSQAQNILLPTQLSRLVSSMVPVLTQFHADGHLAPHATKMDRQGRNLKMALVVEDGVENCTVEYAIDHFERSFRTAALSKEITACGVFYHGVGASQPERAARTEDEARAIVGRLEHISGVSVYYVVPYIVAAGSIHYESAILILKPASVFIEQAAKPKRWWRIW